MQLKKGFSFAITLVLLLSLLSIAIISIAYYFINKANNNNVFEKNIVTLNTLQQLDTEWSKNILKTHSYSLQDFDQLAQDMAKIRQALSSLEQQGMSDEKVVGTKTAKQYQIYKHSFATKNEAVERYKSEQAILRNSVRYLPEAGEIAYQALASQQLLDNKKTSALLMMSQLLTSQYLINIRNLEAVKKQLTQLQRQNNNAHHNDEIKNKIQDYLTHANLIVKYKPKVDRMLHSAMSIDIAEESNQLVNQYMNSQETLQQGIKKWQNIMLVGVAMLLALLLWFLLHLRKSASKILLANTQNKAIQQQLLQAEEKIEKVNKNMQQTGLQSASGQLSLNTFKHLNSSMPALAKHISFLKNVKTNNFSSQYKNKFNLLINDMDELYSNIYELNTLINPKQNKNKQVSFDFNHIIQSAFEAVSSENNPSIIYNKQLSSVPAIQASSIDLYQITSKLLQQSASTWKQGDESIFIKTWATGHYANLCLSLAGYDNIEALYADEALIGLSELIEQNNAILKLTPREDGKSAIVWVSFPYQQ